MLFGDPIDFDAGSLELMVPEVDGGSPSVRCDVSLELPPTGDMATWLRGELLVLSSPTLGRFSSSISSAVVALLTIVVAACGVGERGDGSGADAGRATRGLSLGNGEIVATGPSRVLVVDAAGDQLVEIGLADGCRAPNRRPAIPLQAGDWPHRAAVDEGARIAFVTLPGNGAVARVDLDAGIVDARVSPCPEPLGIARHPARESVAVACGGGEIVLLDPATLAVLTRERAAPDLRDVVFAAGDWVLSRSHPLELERRHPATLALVETVRPESYVEQGTDRRFEPRVAVRLRRAPDGGVRLLHQLALLNALPLSLAAQGIDPEAMAQRREEEPEGDVPPSVGLDGRYYGAPPQTTIADPCVGPVVQTSVFRWTPGMMREQTALPNSPMPVDLLVADHDRMFVGGGMDRSPDAVDVRIYHDGGRCEQGNPAVAAMDRPLGGLAQLDDGAIVRWLPAERGVACADGIVAPIDPEAGLASVDPGFDRFHEVQSSGVACASCHPGGRQDNHTWTFEGKGPRRTQDVAGMRPDALAFHRDGEHADFDAVWVDGFVDRMGGPLLPEQEVVAVADYLATLSPRPPLAAANDELIADGAAIFETSGCADCHDAAQAEPGTGEPILFDVGTGDRFLAPRLDGLALRGPWFHDGFATVIDETIDGSCATSGLHRLADPSARAALVAYLASR